MKAKYSLGIILVVLLAGCSAKLSMETAAETLKKTFHFEDKDTIEVIGIEHQSREIWSVKYKINGTPVNAKITKTKTGWQLQEIQTSDGPWVPALKAAELIAPPKKAPKEESKEMAIAPRPDNPQDWQKRANDLFDLGRYEEAIKAYENAIKIKDDYLEARVNKGAALLRIGRYEEAIQSCRKAIERKSDFQEAWYNQACGYSLMRNKMEAIISLTRVISLDSKWKDVAKKDQDFKWLWDDKDFKKVVE